MTAADRLPPLVLSCRPGWRTALAGAALVLMGLGAATLASDPGRAGPVVVLTAAILLAAGAGCAHLFLRYGLARLVLDDDGFRLEGPFRRDPRVEWVSVISWARVRTGPGPRTLRVLHGARRRLSVPLIYEGTHLLELGLAQRRFPRA